MLKAICSILESRRIFELGLALLLCLPFAVQSEVEAVSEGTARERILKGLLALDAQQADSARDFFLSAYQEGMSADSLYYFLSEVANRKLAYDTAMVFNLSIRALKDESFRQAVMQQRYRLYVQVGLKKEADAVLDSMTVKPLAPRRPKELRWRLGAGYFLENNHAARDYPFGIDLGGYLSEGWQFRNQAELLWPLPSLLENTWNLGFTADAIKSYAKDSLDYRGGLLIRNRGFFSDSLAITLSGQFGQITGYGFVSSYKLETAYLVFTAKGLSLLQAGYESERDKSWRNRFEGLWFSLYHDRAIRKGHGFNFALTGSWIRIEPTEERTNLKVMYVDDVSKTKPTHFQNQDFRDSLPGNGITTFLRYISATGSYESVSRSPQGLAMLIPSMGYTVALPWKISGDISGSYAAAYYPQPYAWQEVDDPPQFDKTSSDFHGLAMNRADGKLYSAVLAQQSGGFQEYYGSTPLREQNFHRLDQQLGINLSLRRPWPRLGIFSLEGITKRNWSNLEKRSPIWIPNWNFGVSLNWNRNWEW